jgi:hypothetical protein
MVEQHCRARADLRMRLVRTVRHPKLHSCQPQFILHLLRTQEMQVASALICSSAAHIPLDSCAAHALMDSYAAQILFQASEKELVGKIITLLLIHTQLDDEH